MSRTRVWTFTIDKNWTESDLKNLADVTNKTSITSFVYDKKAASNKLLTCYIAYKSTTPLTTVSNLIRSANLTTQVKDISPSSKADMDSFASQQNTAKAGTAMAKAGKANIKLRMRARKRKPRLRQAKRQT